MGGGMGRGGGMGKGMGGGMRTSGWAAPNPIDAAPLSKEEELKRLKAQAKDLHKQIEDIESRINESEKK